LSKFKGNETNQRDQDSATEEGKSHTRRNHQARQGFSKANGEADCRYQKRFESKYSFLIYPTPFMPTFLRNSGMNLLTLTVAVRMWLQTANIARPEGDFTGQDSAALLRYIIPWDRDRLIVELYAERIRTVVKRALLREEAIMVVAYPVFHAN
jgi:hypothetical protein